MGKSKTSEFSSGLKAVINLFTAVRMKNSKSSCPAEHFPKHRSDLRVYFLQTSSQPWTPNSFGHFRKWDRRAEIVRRNYRSTTKHFWWCLRAWAIPVEVSFLKNQWVLKCFAGLSPEFFPVCSLIRHQPQQFTVNTSFIPRNSNQSLTLWAKQWH